MTSTPINHRATERAIIMGAICGVMLSVGMASFFWLMPLNPNDDPALRRIMPWLSLICINTLTTTFVVCVIFSSRRIELLPGNRVRIAGPFFSREFRLDEIQQLRWWPQGCSFEGADWRTHINFLRDRRENAVMEMRWWRRAIPVSNQKNWESTAYRWLMSQDWRRQCGPADAWIFRKRKHRIPLIAGLSLLAVSACALIGWITGKWLPMLIAPLLLITFAATILLISIPREGEWVQASRAPHLRPLRRLAIGPIVAGLIGAPAMKLLPPIWMGVFLGLSVVWACVFFYAIHRYELWLSEYQKQLVKPHLADWEAEWLAGPLPPDWPAPPSA